MTALNCSACPSYNKGKGSRACLQCDIFEEAMPKYRPNPATGYLSHNLIDEMQNGIPIKSSYDVLKRFDDFTSTILFQHFILQMTLQEISNYHNNVLSPSSISRKIAQSANTIKKILLINQMFIPPS